MLKEKNGIASLCCVCPLTVCNSIPFHSVVLNFGRSVRPTPVHTETQDRRTRTGKKKFMQKQQTKIKNKRFFFLIYCTSFSFYFFISYSFHFIYILLINNKISHPFHWVSALVYHSQLSLLIITTRSTVLSTTNLSRLNSIINCVSPILNYVHHSRTAFTAPAAAAATTSSF